ncbi:MAG: hypothetical protein AAB506_02995 [Patescibacteria group bacterium]
MTEKIVGYFLLGIGILVIVFAAANIYFVFTGQAQPVQLFHLSSVSLQIPNLGKTDLISAVDLNQTSNLGAQLLLMGFLAGIGQKLASLGVGLVRPIVIKSRE